MCSNSRISCIRMTLICFFVIIMMMMIPILKIHGCVVTIPVHIHIPVIIIIVHAAPSPSSIHGRNNWRIIMMMMLMLIGCRRRGRCCLGRRSDSVNDRWER